MFARTELAMQRTHNDLAAEAQTGDKDALRQIYEQYHADVYRLAYRLLGDREDAADVRQETFLSAFQALGRFRGDSSLKTWLLTICTNLCRKRLAAKRRRNEVEFDAERMEACLREADDAHEPLAAAVRSETARLVRIALGSLPIAERELLILRELEGLEYEEMARITGCSASTVGVKLFRARQRLRERIDSILNSGRPDHV
jgi:RNA polymerase sigma-70 factor (ECF subfamily)